MSLSHETQKKEKLFYIYKDQNGNTSQFSIVNWQQTSNNQQINIKERNFNHCNSKTKDYMIERNRKKQILEQTFKPLQLEQKNHFIPRLNKSVYQKKRQFKRKSNEISSFQNADFQLSLNQTYLEINIQNNILNDQQLLYKIVDDPYLFQKNKIKGKEDFHRNMPLKMVFNSAQQSPLNINQNQQKYNTSFGQANNQCSSIDSEMKNTAAIEILPGVIDQVCLNVILQFEDTRSKFQNLLSTCDQITHKQLELQLSDQKDLNKKLQQLLSSQYSFIKYAFVENQDLEDIKNFIQQQPQDEVAQILLNQITEKQLSQNRRQTIQIEKSILEQIQMYFKYQGSNQDIQIDKELKTRVSDYWRFDKKGRNIEELQNKVINRKIQINKRLFSRKQDDTRLKIKNVILQIVRKMQQMKVTPEELIEKNVIMKKPYQRDGSYAFFKSVKRNDIEIFKTFVKLNRYYLFDKNHHYKTCLHIVAEKGFIELCRIIIESGCLINEGDLLGRSALYYAAKYNHKEIVRLLLKSKAQPYINLPQTTLEINQIIQKGQQVRQNYKQKCIDIHNLYVDVIQKKREFLE